MYPWQKNNIQHVFVWNILKQNPQLSLVMPSVAQGSFLWHSVPVASQRLDSSDQFWTTGNQTTWGLSSWSVILKLQCIPKKDLHTTNIKSDHFSRVPLAPEFWAIVIYDISPFSLHYLCESLFFLQNLNLDLVLVIFWVAFFFSQIHASNLSSHGPDLRRVFFTVLSSGPTDPMAAEVLSELALAMRLNVELCDASERVEKLNYRWWCCCEEFFVKQKGGGVFPMYGKHLVKCNYSNQLKMLEMSVFCRQVSGLQCVRAKEVMLECCWSGAALHWLLPQGYDDDHWQRCRRLMLISGDAKTFRRRNRETIPNAPNAAKHHGGPSKLWTYQVSCSLWRKTHRYSSKYIYIYIFVFFKESHSGMQFFNISTSKSAPNPSVF